MSLIFLGGMYPGELYDEIFKNSNGAVSFAANKYQWNLLNGLDANCNNRVKVLSTPFIKTYPAYKEAYVKKKYWSHLSADNGNQDMIVPFVNVRGIRQFSRYHAIKKALIELVKNDNEDCSILIYTLDYAFLKAVAEIKELYPNAKAFAFVPDLPTILAQYKTKFDLYHTLTKQYNLKKVDYYREKLDGYVIMAEQMAELLEISKDQYCVVDGICDPEDCEREYTAPQSFDGINRIVYTGALNSNSGINLLLDAFTMIEGSNYRLVIAGSGYFEDLIRERSKTDPRIQYLGSLPKEKVSEVQKQATVLVNPRPASGIDSAYSFPSKTIEYLLTKRPVAMFRLLGVSDDYYKYIYQFTDESPEEMSKMLQSICCTEETVLVDRGNKAREFVLNNKNCFTQTKKIVDFIQKIQGHRL